ncbi:MAG: NADH-quinone oxidoreductase subunit F [Candidatus Izemoplasmatales bacterium]
MKEMRVISKRFGRINPTSISDYMNFTGYASLKKALKMDRIKIIEEVQYSKLRGRGGAGFPTHIKMMGLAKETNIPKYIVCNADEGEPGNFKDRNILEQDPFSVIEGMTIMAYATGASLGFIYIRGEYKEAILKMKECIKTAKENNLLGNKILGENFDFDITVRSGAGSYVCGEEFALIESIEGKPGRTRVKPPFPTEQGVYRQPTVINNVETFANLPVIIDIGGKEYSKIGTPSSTGTKLICLSGNVNHPGLVEIPFGVPIRDVITDFGGGIKNNRKIKMVQLGGACGPIIPEYMLDMIIDYERFEEFESKTGSGAIIVIDDRFDLFDILLKTIHFFSHESCGKCVPCREGHLQLELLIRKFIKKEATIKDLDSLESLARVMHQTSLCGLGQTSPTAIISALRYFRDDFLDRLDHSKEQ